MLRNKYVALCLAIISLLVIINLDLKSDGYVQSSWKWLDFKNEERKQHFMFPIPLWQHNGTCAPRDDRPFCQTCIIKPHLWDCVGSDRSWSLVFVDNRPREKRGPNAQRLISQTEVLIRHDSSGGWKGRKTFTTGNPKTILVQGDKDQDGKIFDKVIELFNNSQTVKDYAKDFNPKHSGWGSHVRLLAAAAMATTGDMLEMGTGYFSTPLVHDVVKRQGGTRTILSTDTDANWLTLFKDLSGPFHQIRYIPVFEDGGVCADAKYKRPSTKAVQPEELEFAGLVETGLVTNQMIECPK